MFMQVTRVPKSGLWYHGPGCSHVSQGDRVLGLFNSIMITCLPQFQGVLSWKWSV